MRFLLALALACAVASPQSNGPTETGVVIRATTRLVQVRVSAQNSSGRPVADLQKEDFQVLDNKRQQMITLFSADRGAAPPANAQTEAVPEPRDGYSVILLDWLNSRYAEKVQANALLAKLLKRFQPRQEVALLVLGMAPLGDSEPLRLIHDFTSNKTELLNAMIDPVLPPGAVIARTPSWPGRGARTVNNDYGGGSATTEQLIRDTLRAMEELADRFSRVSGRKSLVWVTDGFPFVLNGQTSYVSEVAKLLDKFASADAAIYPVDARGLTIGGGEPNIATMQEFAWQTGGVAFYDRNDLDEGVRAGLEDSRASYDLGYAVPEGTQPGLHRIQIRSNKSGIHLVYRMSYVLEDSVK